MKDLIIINGPNLNLLGKREKDIYGNIPFRTYLSEQLIPMFQHECSLDYFQSNSEGALVDKIQEVGFNLDGIILNGGAYTHSSIAIADAIAAITTPVVEVHISNVYAREAFRKHSYFSPNCAGVIVGMGLKGYELGIRYFL